jgi:sec-independent protein translocase protein TatA
MGMPGGFELLAILVIVVLIFGGKKIPELMKGIGSGIKNFKQAVKDDEEKPEIAKTEEKKDTNIANSETQKTENRA